MSLQSPGSPSKYPSSRSRIFVSCEFRPSSLPKPAVDLPIVSPPIDVSISYRHFGALDFFSPLWSKTPRGSLRSPRKDRGGSASGRSGLGAVRRATAQQAPVAAQADRLRAAGATELDRPCRRGSAAGADVPCGGVGWLTELRNATACRREGPAYAARISRSMDAFDCNNRDSGHTTGLLRACICICWRSGVRISATSEVSGSVDAVIGGTRRYCNSI